MTKFVMYVSLIVGVLSIAQGYRIVGYEAVTRWSLVFGAAWTLAEIRRWRWFASVGLLAAVTLAGYGLWIGLSSGWMLAGALGALFAWDLSDFGHRMSNAAPEDDAPGLERRHLLRLTIVASVGVIFSLFGMLARLQFSFELLAFLAILAALGLTQLVGWMRRGGKDEG